MQHEMKLPPQVLAAFDRLENAGFEAYLVGGAVRDFVRREGSGQDWDLTTSALPEQTKQVFSGYRIIETGIKHGTVTVVLDGVPLEITTYRVDGGYADCRHPDSVLFTGNLQEDLLRRDFTMNALAWNPHTGLIDFAGGEKDAVQGIIRCVGEPDRRFQEDGLRMLRALRFASAHEMTIETETAAAIHRNRDLLQKIAAERIQAELTGLLCGAAVKAVLQEFPDVLAVPIPELAPMVGFLQYNPHHDRDVWEHTAAVVAAISPSPVLRWAALLHDAGKPSCFSRGSDGIGHFYGHAEKSTELADEILSRLRFDHNSRLQIAHLIRYHDLPLSTDRKALRRLLCKHGEQITRQLVELHRADICGLAPQFRDRLAMLEETEQILEEILQEENCFSLKKLAVNGNDLLALGLRGRDIGQTLQLCLDSVVEEILPNDREALLDFVKMHKIDGAVSS